MKTFILFFILFSIFSVATLQAQNPPKLVDMSNKIPIAGTQASLTDVQKVGNTLWISCSSSSVIFRSTDGGNTFTSPATASATQAIYMFPDATNGWAVGGAKGNKTTDGGQSWISPNTTIGGTLYDVYFPTSLIGYAVGNSGVVYKTENGGANWVLKTIVLNASVLSAVFPSSSDPNTGYIALSNAITTIYKTTNGGTSWSPMTLSGITSSMSCLEFIDANTGWAAGGNGEIFSFKNGTWAKQTSPVTTSLNGISFASDGLNGWAVGNGGVILHTTNGGTTWTQEGTGLTSQNLSKVDVVSATEAYIVGYGKTFIKYTTDYGTVGINPGLVSPEGFEVFPNPGNGRFNLKIPAGQQVHSILVVNTLGQTVRNVVISGEGSEFTFDLSDQPNGFYILRCLSEKGLVCRKLVKR